MDVELARQQWEDGRRRVERALPAPRSRGASRPRSSSSSAELRRRVGQTFTLEQLAARLRRRRSTGRAMSSTRRVPEGAPPPDAATVTDAAFQLYARGALDYTP